MITPPLLAFGLFVSGVCAQPAPGPQPPKALSTEQSTALKDAGFDAKFMSPAALPADPAKRAEFLQAHREEYDRFVAWRQDPDLMFEAERKKPGSADAALARMEAFAKPEEVGLLRARLRLAPRGVSADVPERAGFEGRPPESSSVSSAPPQTRSAHAGPASAAPPLFTPGFKTNAPPGPLAPKTEPPKGGDAMVDDWVAAWCKVIGC
ncbi:MAG: hypothetical protein HY928_03805 [Elusimicrobia bacterium]|nr:hypothetical protein [Elusimicrobiota bacterium]